MSSRIRTLLAHINIPGYSYFRFQHNPYQNPQSVNKYYYQLTAAAVLFHSKMSSSNRDNNPNKESETKLHVRARGNYDKYPKRFPVPDIYVPWSVEWSDYRAVEYTDENMAKKSPDPMDPTEIKDIGSRMSYEGFDVNHNSNRSLNPRGRTGLSGRGKLYYWGPNHAADPLVTRVNERNQLEFVAISRQDGGEWALPGGMVDKGESPEAAAKREFEEEACDGSKIPASQLAEQQQLREKIFDLLHQKIIYKGYVDDPRNTDNSWVETCVVNWHCPYELSKKLKMQAGDDATQVRWLVADESINDEYKHLYANHREFIEMAKENLLQK